MNDRASWFITTADAPWQRREVAVAEVDALPDVMLKLDGPRQVVEGFGACFNELGWDALSRVEEGARDGILRELFGPGEGAQLSLCRMPLGANDFSRDWYSYDETPGDFALAHFDIGNDLDTLVPFIRAATAHRPDLRLWASPWSPPTWMKTNGHYAAALPVPHWGVDNGLSPEQVGHEGTDMFVLEEPYLAAYAAYFGRFVDAYRELGIDIEMVMPQNEFNSPQIFPSCTWTPEGLARFLRHLGPEMSRRGVEVFLGTLERGDDRLAGVLLDDPEVAVGIAGVGLQWYGKQAVTALHRLYPGLRIYQTEQECGDGRNDWRHARHAWSLMKHFFGNGANAYTYWNIALLEGQPSRWGWRQNSLVMVDPETGVPRFTYEYQVLKHASAYVRPGARVIDTWSITGHDNQLVFRNPDGSLVIAVQNDLGEDLTVRFLIGDRMIAPTLPADSFNTIVWSKSKGLRE